MKRYVITTGTVFGLLALAHVWRAIVEGPQLFKQPFFVVVTVIAAALCVWAILLVRRAPRT